MASAVNHEQNHKNMNGIKFLSIFHNYFNVKVKIKRKLNFWSCKYYISLSL